MFLQCGSPQVARNGPPTTSAIRSLMGANRTSCGQPISVENDPQATWGMSSSLDEFSGNFAYDCGTTAAAIVSAWPEAFDGHSFKSN